MLDDTLKSQLQTYLGMLRQPIRLIASLDDSETGVEMRSLLETIVGLSDKVTLDTSGDDSRKPSFVVARETESTGVRFAGLPLGHEFTSLVLALLWTGGHPPKVEQDVLDSIKALDGDFNFEVYMSLTCHNCPDVVQALSLMAIFNPKIKTVVIEGGAFQKEVTDREIMAVPMVFLNGEVFGSGRMGVEEIVAKLDVNAGARDAAKLNAKDDFDVLIVGGGPAGAAAAVYAARKGIRVGVAAERFGGQTNDTMAIENYISVLETNGPKFAAALEEQVRHYGVDIMNLQRAAKVIPASVAGGLVQVQMENGGTLKARTVILSTGARWRNVNVPGEQQYKNKGVAYCPHCDGPLFKGKRTAVIGGGNSGIEAAIDLAGIVEHVTVIEFADQLKADAVLVNKLNSLPYVAVDHGKAVGAFCCLHCRWTRGQILEKGGVAVLVTYVVAVPDQSRAVESSSQRRPQRSCRSGLCDVRAGLRGPCRGTHELCFCPSNLACQPSAAGSTQSPEKPFPWGC